MLELLAPGVQNREETDAGQTMRGRYLLKCFGDLGEEQTVNQPPIVQGQPRQLAGKGHDRVKVGHGQELIASPFKPAGPLSILATRTVAVAAGVVHHHLVAAVVTAVTVPTTQPRAASGQPMQGADRFGTHLLAVPLEVRRAETAGDLAQRNFLAAKG